MILIQRNIVWHTYMKDGPYIRGKSPSKADGSKRFITSVRDYQKAGLPVTYHQGMVLVSTNAPVFPT